MHYDWNFNRLVPYISAFERGALITVALTAITIVLGTAAGGALSYLLINRITRPAATLLVDVIRAVPPLVLLLFAYFFLTPQVIGVSVSGFWVAALALSLNLGAFASEVLRAEIEAVPRGEVEAAVALGFSASETRRYIIVPTIVRRVIPVMVILYIGMLKLSSLAAIINVGEIVYTAQTVIANVSRSLEAWVVVAATFVVIVVPATYAARHLERRLLRGRPER